MIVARWSARLLGAVVLASAAGLVLYLLATLAADLLG